MARNTPRATAPKARVTVAHTPGPWASMPPSPSGQSHEVWTALSGGTLRRVAVVDPSDGAAVDAALMAAAPQLAHELAATAKLIEKLMATPGVLDVLADLCHESDLEAALIHRVGCHRHLARVIGVKPQSGVYELPQHEARWYVPEQAYRDPGKIDDPDGVLDPMTLE